MQYSCGKININIPDGYGDIKDIVFSAHIIVRYNNGHCGGIDPHIIGLCKKADQKDVSISYFDNRI
ncbi:glycosyltransferase involved exopolysaccharide (EPS) synthesis [Streptococcus pneumoniae]|nr:glycosyltransferase involved exopolysaccharide (EPS) synthesis [Streptococcus pneumoniae]VIW59703.1 glycosyltransferase involved exopolysaccharide (EPS) synthesis [Streptococcus pneumoniae]VOA08850.1 glycosyltransferase involved exopolysaccharide (EPS) synthesis [Streptococcus pneumoniae]VSH76978.1 glycosyltransferase involved exopolysaccharide (EPS) synthesis [Streptococcus pneumoniae]VSL53420.1 glycosyltransferase involved exopolysaccharide (EPS) synthesis [Streptococcus pneumoniae]